jgi:hypothetical protein
MYIYNALNMLELKFLRALLAFYKCYRFSEWLKGTVG